MTDEPMHWDSNIRRYCYAKIAENEVSVDLFERVKAMATFVCAELDILNPPKIVWIQPTEPSAASAVLGSRAQDLRLEERHPSFTRLRRNIGGGYTPGRSDLHEIWIRSDLVARPDLEFVVAHELRHAWQKLNAAEVFRNEDKAEADAYPYGYDVLKRYLAAKGELTAALCEDIEKQRTKAENRYQDGQTAQRTPQPGN